MATSGFVTDAEIIDVLNDEMPEVYRLLVEVGPPDYYSATTTVTTVNGTVAYALPADFFQETTLYSTDAMGYRRPLLPIQDWGLARVRAPQTAVTVTLEYVPTPIVLAQTAGQDVFDGIAGWDSLLTCRVARRLLQKRKADSGSLDAEIGQLTEHLSRGARRNKGPRYTRDVEDAYGWPTAMPYLATVSNYRIRGGNVELYVPLVLP